MALSDCNKCWQTPCECGYEYKGWGKDNLSIHIASITQYRSKQEAKEIISKALSIIDEKKDWRFEYTKQQLVNNRPKL